MKKNIFYWSPCLNPVGTLKSTLNSALSLKKYNGLIHAVNSNPTTMLNLLKKLSDNYSFCFKIFTPNIILKLLFRVFFMKDFYDDIVNSSKNVVSVEMKKISHKFYYTEINDL